MRRPMVQRATNAPSTELSDIPRTNMIATERCRVVEAGRAHRYRRRPRRREGHWSGAGPARRARVQRSRDVPFACQNNPSVSHLIRIVMIRTADTSGSMSIESQTYNVIRTRVVLLRLALSSPRQLAGDVEDSFGSLTKFESVVVCELHKLWDI